MPYVHSCLSDDDNYTNIGRRLPHAPYEYHRRRYACGDAAVVVSVLSDTSRSQAENVGPPSGRVSFWDPQIGPRRENWN